MFYKISNKGKYCKGEKFDSLSFLVVYIMGVLQQLLPPGLFLDLDLGLSGNFRLKIRQEKFTKILNYIKFLCFKLF